MPLRPRRTASAVALVLVAATAVAGCSDGGDGGRSAADRLAERARSGAETAYEATFSLTSGPSVDRREEAQVRVWRTADSLRLDITTSGGVARSITTASGVVACQTPPEGKSTCLTVAGPDEDPPPAFDPTLSDVFGTMLDAFAADRSLEVSDADPVETAAGEDVACFRIGGNPSGVVETGTYCLTDDGVPVHVVFGSGQLALDSIEREAPAAGTFEPPVEPSPLPSA